MLKRLPVMRSIRASLGLGLALVLLGAAPCAAEEAAPSAPEAGTPAALPQAQPAASDHAPRVFALHVGSSYVFRNRLPLTQDGRETHPYGVTLGGRVGWQVGGLSGLRAPSFIGFETDVLLQAAKDARQSYALLYGVFIKHALSRQLRVRPYFAYGLGAAQVWVSDVDGRGIGHATRLGLGVDVPLSDLRQLAIALSYQGILMPRFSEGDGAKSTSFHSLVLTLGLWFGR
jgi:hypothetical protein